LFLINAGAVNNRAAHYFLPAARLMSAGEFLLLLWFEKTAAGEYNLAE